MTEISQKIKRDLEEIGRLLGEYAGSEDNRKQVLAVYSHLLCRHDPSRYSAEQCENFRRLALEYGYDEQKDLNSWIAERKISKSE